MAAITQFFWHRQPAVDAALLSHFADFVGPGKLVVDVGAGYDPWPYATEFVDRETWPQLTDKTVHALDVELDRLPYADKSVDFLYCRHTIEDLHNPTLLLREMNRVAKAGYIETPSPIAEMCPGVNGEGAYWRGYAHHCWFCWRDCETGKLTLLPKLAFLEGLVFSSDFDEKLAAELSAFPESWNTYLPWVDNFDFSVLRCRADFDVLKTYGPQILKAIHASKASAAEFVRSIRIHSARAVPSHVITQRS